MATPIVKEVMEYLSANRDQYVQFQNELERDLKKLNEDPKWREVIYKVYSRAEKQPEDPLKKHLENSRKIRGLEKEK